MRGEDKDPLGLSHWPEEFLLPGDFGKSGRWSYVLVESGLRNADLGPLAEHLRRGYPLSQGMAVLIASAIEGHADAPCRISAKRSAGRPAGRPRTGVNPRDALTHNDKVDIGIDAERALRGLARSAGKKIMPTLCDRHQVSETTVNKCRRYVNQWVANIDRTSRPEKISNSGN